MDNGKYYRKWSITYKGKPYLHLYGKKNAYDLLHRLNKSFMCLDVQPFIDEPELPRKRKRNITLDQVDNLLEEGGDLYHEGS